MPAALKRFVLVVFVLFVYCFTFSQTKTTTHINQVWLGYFNQTRLSDKWGIWAEAHLRTKEEFFNNFSQAIVRTGIMYYLNDEAKLTVGYAFVNHFPADNHKNISQPEHRPWQQLQWHTRSSSLRLMQWIRLEERFRHRIQDNDNLGDGYNFNFRFRYNILAQFPLSKKKFQPGSLSFAVSDEVMVNAGKEIVNNYFDQNRFFAGFHYYVNKHDQLQFGYMNLFQQLAAGNQYRSIHAARVFYFHNLDLRKKKE